MKQNKPIPEKDIPDSMLIDRYRTERNPEVLGRLYSRYMPLVYGICLKYLKQSDEAQDSVMAIYEELVNKLLQHEVENFRSWLYTFSKNHCLMKLRSGKKMRVVDLDEGFMQNGEEMHLNEVFEKENALQALETCLGQLKEEQRKAIELFYLKEKCYLEIAAETGLEWKQVRSFIRNGRRNLKICMDQQVVQQQHGAILPR